MSNAINSFIFLDVETGGLDPNKHAVTEIAAIAIKGDTLEKIDLVSTFIKPYGNYGYDPEALKHTGITMEDIESGVSVQDAVEEMVILLRKSDFNPRNKGSKPILVAYNSPFDKGFVTQLFEFCKRMKDLESLTYGKVDFYGNYQPEMLDAIHFTKLAFGHDKEIPNYKLGTCLSKAGIELADAHRAINDTIGMKDMIVQFTNALRFGKVEGGEALETNGFRKHFQF